MAGWSGGWSILCPSKWGRKTQIKWRKFPQPASLIHSWISRKEKLVRCGVKSGKWSHVPQISNSEAAVKFSPWVSQWNPGWKKTKFILWWDFPFSTAINWFVSKCEICQDLDLCWTRCETSQLEKFPFSLVSAVKYVQIRRAIKRCSLRLQDHKMFHRSGKVVGLLK